MASKEEKLIRLCIDNGGYPVSLEVGKVYVKVLDQQSAGDNCVRVIDESGDDYLYPERLFVSVAGPPEVTPQLPTAIPNSESH